MDGPTIMVAVHAYLFMGISMRTMTIFGKDD